MPGQGAGTFSFVAAVVQLLNHVLLFATPWIVAHQAPLSSTISWSLLKFMFIESTESVMLSNHPVLCSLLLLLPSTFPSIRVFSKESVLPIRWPKYWSFSFSISPSIEYSWPISLRLTHFTSLQSKGFSRGFSSTTIWKHQFFSTQPSLRSNSHICTWLLEKTYLWLDRSLSAKWCLCFFNMLSRFAIAFLPRSMHLFPLRGLKFLLFLLRIDGPYSLYQLIIGDVHHHIWVLNIIKYLI